jgi:hypothetical protein
LTVEPNASLYYHIAVLNVERAQPGIDRGRKGDETGHRKAETKPGVLLSAGNRPTVDCRRYATSRDDELG